MDEEQSVGEPRAGTAARAATTLRELLALVDAGEVEATAAERAHLAGAADAVERLG